MYCLWLTFPFSFLVFSFLVLNIRSSLTEHVNIIIYEILNQYTVIPRRVLNTSIGFLGGVCFRTFRSWLIFNFSFFPLLHSAAYFCNIVKPGASCLKLSIMPTWMSFDAKRLFFCRYLITPQCQMLSIFRGNHY